MSNSNNIFTKFKELPVDGMTKTIVVAVSLCLVCSMVVSFAAVNLKNIQETNKAVDKQKNILQQIRLLIRLISLPGMPQVCNYACFNFP